MTQNSEKYNIFILTKIHIHKNLEKQFTDF